MAGVGRHISRMLSEVIMLMSQGGILESVRQFMCGGSPIALRRPKGTIMAIAIGESVRRVAAKVLVDSFGTKVQAWL